MTTQTISRDFKDTISLTDRMKAHVQSALMRIRRYEKQAAARSAISNLSAEQLEDAGIETGDDAKPVLTVKAGLMANLMSLR